MSDTALLYSGPGTVTPECHGLTPHHLQILQWMIRLAAEGLLILSRQVPAKPGEPEGISGELHV